MKTQFCITFLLLLLCLAGCGEKTAREGELLVLDVESAIDTKRPFSLQDIAEKIDFIPLDDSDDKSLIGNSIQQMGESKDRFYIMDNVRSPVKIFDKKGKFLFTAGTIGRGPGELPFISSITVDYPKDNVYLIASSAGAVAYDTDGRIFARNDSVSGDNSLYHNGQLISLVTSFDDQPEPGSKITLAKIFSPDLRYEGSIEVLDKGSTSMTMPDPEGGTLFFWVSNILSGNGNALLVKEGRSDTVFRYANDMTLEPVYYLDMGSHSAPPEVFGSNPAEQWSDKYYSVASLYDGDRYVIAMVFNTPFGARGYLVFDKKTVQE